MKAAVEQVREEYAFSERHACRVLQVPVSSYRYEPRTNGRSLARTVSGAGAREAPLRLSTAARFVAAVRAKRSTTSACIASIARRGLH